MFKEVVPGSILDAHYYEGIKGTMPSNVQFGPR